MKQLLGFLLVTLTATFASLPAEPIKIVGYYPNWAIYRQPSFKPKDIAAKLVTHINYAFIKVDASGNLILIDPWADVDYRTDWNNEKPYWGNFLQLNELKAQNPHLKTLASIGGWTLSDPFSQMAENPHARSHFVRQCLEFCDKYDFDGIDIDWEYPGFAEHGGRPEDKKHFTLLLKELYLAAKAHEPPLLVTIAAPAGPVHCGNMELSTIHPYVDWFNLMGYDFHGPWGGGEDEVTNHQSALYQTEQGDPRFNVDSAVTYYLKQGVPSKKIVLGMPLYGRSYAASGGLYSTYRGIGEGTTNEAGIRFFSDINERLLGSYIRHWDEQAKVPYLYHPETGQFISYDDEQSLAIKCRYIKEKKLGGAMVWELGLDTRPSWDAMNTIHRVLKQK